MTLDPRQQMVAEAKVAEAKKPLRLVAYGSATHCQSDITSFAMVSFGSIPGVNHEYVHQRIQQEGYAVPSVVPESKNNKKNP